tara:strand:- start:737 stop:1501 length:765 start_codon:yes stop_codon:yes gene_type:complete
MKSPLQIDSSKALGIVKKVIPENSTVTSMLFYDGTVEVPLAHSNRIVVARTDSYAVYEFWSNMLTNAAAISDSVRFLYEKLTEPELYLLQDNWLSYKRDIERSSFFYILNRCSDVNYASHGKINKGNLNKYNISSLKRFKVKSLIPVYDKDATFEELVVNAANTDYILVTPGDYQYNFFDYGQSYGPDMSMISHKKIHSTLIKTDSRWVLVYNKHPAVFKLYEDFNLTMIDKYGNKTKNKERCSEIIVNNFVSV